MTPPREESLWLRLALHAYPRRWRARRQPELLGVLADNVPDRPRWPGLKALVDLVLGGWRTRWHLHPPFWRWMGYRFLDLRLPAAWRDWARSDINGAWWRLRRTALTVPVWLILGANALNVGHGDFGSMASAPEVLFVIAVVLSLMLLPFTGWLRSKALRRHAPDSTRPVMWVPTYLWWPAPVRRRATPSLLSAGVLLAVGAPVAIWALLYPNNGPVSQAVSFGSDEENLGHVVALTWGAAGAGAIVALLLLVLGRHRVTRRLASRTTGSPGTTPTQRLPRSKLAAISAIQLLVEALICLGQLAGVIPGVFALALACGGLCAGPLLIALAYTARACEQASGIDVTFHDCERAILGREPWISREVGRWITTAQPVPVEGPQLP